MATQVTENSVGRTIAAIYSAAVSPGSWSDVLDQLRHVFDASVAVSVVRSADRSKVDGIAAGVNHDEYQAFLGKYYRNSPFLKDDKTWFPGQIVRGADIVPHSVFQRTQMYQDFWVSNDMHESLRMAVSRDIGGVHHSVNVFRPESAAQFGAAELALARTLMPHFQHATEIGRRLRYNELLASAALSTLDILHHAVLLLDADGRILHANAVAEALLLASDGIETKNGIPRAPSPSMTVRLHAIIAHAAGRTGMPPRAGSLYLPRRAGAPLMMLAVPFRQETQWSVGARPMVLMCISNPDAAITVSGRLMVELFGLTGAEAALATDLVQGKSPRQIAEERGRSINTVRAQLARLMAKTDVNRQSDLVRLLANLPRAGDAG